MVSTPQIELANLGMADSLILMVLALVVFGPRRLPQIGRQIGKLMYEFRKASNDFKFQMEEELRLSEDAERRKKEEEERQRTAALAAPANPDTAASVDAQAQTEPATTDPIAGERSPYPGEEVYPPVVEEPAPAPEPQQVVIPRVGPVIQPPSTGEPIPAARYGAGRAVPQADGDGSSNGEPGASPAPAEEVEANSSGTEPTTHHG